MKIEKITGIDKYNELTIHYDITLDQTINLGNNFTFEHFIEALKESGEWEELIECISETEIDSSISIIAKGNFGLVELDNYDSDELYSILVNH